MQTRIIPIRCWWLVLLVGSTLLFGACNPMRDTSTLWANPTASLTLDAVQTETLKSPSTAEVSTTPHNSQDSSDPVATPRPATDNPEQPEIIEATTVAIQPTVSLPSTPTPTLTDSAQPQVLSFSAETQEILTLSWETLGDSVTICPLINKWQVGCQCLNGLPPSGTTTIRPDQIVGNYTGFELLAFAGNTQATARITVNARCPSDQTWAFETDAVLCPKAAPLDSLAAVQHFEHGWMIWVEATDTYYILYDHDLHVSDAESGWSSEKSLHIMEGPLDLKPGASADNRVEELPPSGLYQPVSGFGLVWRSEVTGVEALREHLGWATEPEYGFDTLYQCEVSCGANWNCYLQGPEGESLHFYWLSHFGYYWDEIHP